MSGYIKLYRDIQYSVLWEDKPFNKATAWIDLLIIAKFRDEKVLIGNQMINVKRGEIITSTEELQKRWGWGNTRVRSFIRLLLKESMIKPIPNQKQTAFEIVNYSKYQDRQTDEMQKPNRTFNLSEDIQKANQHLPQNQTGFEIDGESESQILKTVTKPIPNRYQTDNRVNIYKEVKELKEEEEILCGAQKSETPQGLFKNPHAIIKKPSEIQEIPFSEIIGYLNTKTGSHYMDSTKSYRILIKARWEDGFRLEEFKKVIDNKVEDWLGTEHAKYIRPETLFGTKFQSYLNQPKKKRQIFGKGLVPSKFEPSDKIKEVPWT